MKKSLIIILCCILIFQVIIATRVIYHDDAIFLSFITESKFFDTELNAHPPLPVWVDIILTKILGVHNWTFRLTSILFATGTLYIVYLIEKERKDEISGIIAALCVGLYAWHIRASQMNSGSDGGMFTFFFILTFYLFLKSQKSMNKQKFIVYTGISFGLTCLSKETAFLIIPLLLGVMIIEKTSYKEIIKNTVWITIIGAIIFSIFPITDFLYNDGQTIHAITSRIESVATGIEGNYSWSFLLFFSWFKVIIWAGPLIIYIIVERGIEEKYKLIKDPLWIYLIIIFLFYLICIPQTLDKTRYLMLLIPVLGIICAEYVLNKKQEYEITKKGMIIIGILSIVCLSIFVLLNSYINVVSYESNINPLTLLKNGETRFSIPLFTETDNSGFLINFQIILITYSMSALCLIIKFSFKYQKIIAKYCFIILIILGLAYNCLIIEEYSFHLTSPNYNDAIKKLVVYGKENNLKEPIYILKNYELMYYLNEEYDQFIITYGISDTNVTKIEAFKKELQKQGGTIIFTDMPPIDREGLLWKTINTCSNNLTIIDKNVEVGYVFTC